MIHAGDGENMTHIRLVTTPEPAVETYVTRSPIARKPFGDIVRGLGWKNGRPGFYDPRNDFGNFIEIREVDADGRLWFTGRPPQALLDAVPCSLNGVYVEPIVGDVLSIRFGSAVHTHAQQFNVIDVEGGVVIQNCQSTNPLVYRVFAPDTLTATSEFYDAFWSGRMDAIIEEAADLVGGATHAVVALEQSARGLTRRVHADGRRIDQYQDMPF